MRKRMVLNVLIRGAGIFSGALAAVILVAAFPGRHTAPLQAWQPANPAPQKADSRPDQDKAGMDHSQMPGMDMDEAKKTEAHAVHDMSMGHHHEPGPHMYMTSMRPQTPEDLQRAEQVVETLRPAIEKYKDYRVALADGYKIFLPNLPQPEYHFTSYWNGFLEAFAWDPARPTSLLYKKTADGYRLVGAMYTLPKKATEEKLNERIPLSIARWHLHTNLCLPQKDQALRADWTKFGLAGSIATADACQDAGGRFYPVIFGWMVHIYPYEDSPDKIWRH